VELCARNYRTFDGFVDGVDGIFEDFTVTVSKSLFKYIFIILKLDIIHELNIYKSMMNSRGLTNNGHQLNVQLLKYK
jgi:hypothetical protein